MKISKKAPVIAYTVLSVLLVVAIIIGVNILINQREILENNGKDNSQAVFGGAKDDENKEDDKTSDKDEDKKDDDKKLPLKDLPRTIFKLDDGIESLEVTSTANLTISDENYPSCVQSDGKDGIHYTYDTKEKKGVLEITCSGNVTLYLSDELKEPDCN